MRGVELLSRPLRRVPGAVWGLTVLFGLLLVLWSWLTPLAQGPDEPGHADLVFHLAEGGSYPGADERNLSEGVVGPRFVYVTGFGAEQGAPHYLTPDNAPPRGDRPSFDEYGGDRETGWNNQIPQHPPLYYELLAVALRVERAVIPGLDGGPLDREWHLLRITNALMVMPIPLLAWAAARRIGVNRNAAIAAAAFPLAVPQLLHLGGVLNNDNLFILEGAALAALLAGVVRGDGKSSTAVGVGVVAGLALLTKAFAVVFLVWIAIAYGYRAWRTRPMWWSAARPVLVAAVLAVLIGGWWPLGHIVSDGEPYPTPSDDFYDRDPPGFDPDPVWYLRRFVPTFTHRFWGDFGFLIAPMTTGVVVGATVLCLIAAAVALLPRRWTGDGASRPSPVRLAVLGAVLPMLALAVLVIAYDLYRTSGETPFIQGRYLMGAIVPIAVVVGVGLHRLMRSWAPLAVLVGAGIMQVDAVRIALRHFWATPTSSVRHALASALAWGPWPRPAVGVVVLAAVLCAGATIWALVRPIVQGRPSEQGPLVPEGP